MSIKTLFNRRKEVAAYLQELQQNGKQAPSADIGKTRAGLIKTVEDEIRRLDGRIERQRELLGRREQILREWAEIEKGIQIAANLVAVVTPDTVAEGVRQQVLKPEITWVNPLNQAGAEETRILGRREAIQAIVDRGISGYTEVTVLGLIPPVILQGPQVKNWVLVEDALATISSGRMEVHFGGTAGNRITVRASAGLEEIGGPAIGVLPGAGIGASKPPVIEKPVAAAVAESVLQESAAGLARSVPAALAPIIESLRQFRDTTVETGVYGLIFAERSGLAVGVTLRSAKDQDRKPLARRYVAANEGQEQTLLDLGVDRAEIVPAWAPEFKGDINQAIAAARAQLEADGAIVMDPIRGMTATFAQFMQEIQKLEVLLTPRDYSPESAAKIAQRVYDLFV